MEWRSVDFKACNHRCASIAQKRNRVQAGEVLSAISFRSFLMRKTALAACILILSVDIASAQRPTTTSLSCEQVQGAVRREGGIVMYWQSKRVPGLPRYERLVRDSNFCPPEDYAEPFYVPSADTEKCIVKHCQPRINDDGFIIRNR